MWFLPMMLTFSLVSSNPFKSVLSWRQMSYNFPNDSMRNAYKASGDYIEDNIVPLGLNVWGDKLFITVPRWKSGVAATLNYINLKDAAAAKDTSPSLNPYPDWETNDIHQPEALVNILRVKIDTCDRMWAVDNGFDDIVGGRKEVQPVKLIAIDLKTNKIILKYTFKSSDLRSYSLFTDTIIDVDPKNCDDAYVYNADLGAYGIVVYSLAKHDSWRVSHNYFHMDPFNGQYNVRGLTFQWADGVTGLALSPPRTDGSKRLHFHAMSGTHEFYVSTEVLKNKSASSDPHFFTAFHIAGYKGPMTQGAASAYDSSSDIIYYPLVTRNSIGCWNTNEKLNPQNFRVVAQDEKTLLFPSDITIDAKTRKLYCLADNLPVFMVSKYNNSNTNFYVTVAALDDLTNICRSRRV